MRGCEISGTAGVRIDTKGAAMPSSSASFVQNPWTTPRVLLLLLLLRLLRFACLAVYRNISKTFSNPNQTLI